MTLEDVTLPMNAVKVQLNNTRAFIGSVELGTGVLCVAESNLVWRQENGKGLCLEYPHIALHAVSKDLNAFPHECLYVMLDTNILHDDTLETSDETEQDPTENLTELRFVPEDKTSLGQLFTMMNECQALYPDEEMSGDEEEAIPGDNDEEDVSESEEVPREFEDGDEEGDQIQHVNGNGTTCVNPNEIELSARGQQILRRLNINYQAHHEMENNENDADSIGNEQFEDA